MSEAKKKITNRVQFAVPKIDTIATFLDVKKALGWIVEENIKDKKKILSLERRIKQLEEQAEEEEEEEEESMDEEPGSSDKDFVEDDEKSHELRRL